MGFAVQYHVQEHQQGLCHILTRRISFRRSFPIFQRLVSHVQVELHLVHRDSGLVPLVPKSVIGQRDFELVEPDSRRLGHGWPLAVLVEVATRHLGHEKQIQNCKGLDGAPSLTASFEQVNSSFFSLHHAHLSSNF